MRRPLFIEIVPTDTPAWPEIIAAVRSHLGAPENPLLFPPHFLQSAFPKIGGRAFAVKQGDAPAAYGFLFPRGLWNGRRSYTVRYHPVPGTEEPVPEEVLAQAASSFPEADLTLYDPRLPQPCERTEIFTDANGIVYGHPDEDEAKAARDIQRDVWKFSDDDSLYPADLYSSSFGAATSLVARAQGKVVGFLFGFYKFGGLPLPQAWSRYEGGLRIESQVAGVHKDYQGRGVGFHLKRLQGRRAQQEGIDIINWTVDPLQSPNANLNFQKLRAVSFRFMPDYYNLSSVQNQTPASRFEVTWLLPAPGAREILSGSKPGKPVDLEAAREVSFANDGLCRTPFEAAPRIAIEIPGNWDEIQKCDRPKALQWRDLTDPLFQDLIGHEEGRYMVTDLGKKDGRFYLVGRRIEADFPSLESAV